MTSAGTFTQGHLGPEVVAPLLGAMAPGAVLAFTVHEGIWESLDFAGVLAKLPLRGVQAERVAIYGDAAAGEAHATDHALMVTARHAP
jgi:hypothetical protein